MTDPAKKVKSQSHRRRVDRQRYSKETPRKISASSIPMIGM